jgi:hypothetical protein
MLATLQSPWPTCPATSLDVMSITLTRLHATRADQDLPRQQDGIVVIETARHQLRA